MPTSDHAEREFQRSAANDPTPLEDRTTASILDEIRDGADWLWMERLTMEIMRRCATYEREDAR